MLYVWFIIIAFLLTYGLTTHLDKFNKGSEEDLKKVKPIALDIGTSLLVGMVVVYMTVPCTPCFWDNDYWDLQKNSSNIHWPWKEYTDNFLVYGIVIFVLIQIFKKYKTQQ
jgi:hypothetical protein